MAKRNAKRRSSKSTANSAVSLAVQQQILFLLGAVATIFILLSVFNAAGSAGEVLFTGWRALFGEGSPMVAAAVIWFVARRFLPERLTYRWQVVVGLILTYVAMLGIFESIGLGIGGGLIGYGLYQGLQNSLGALVAQLVLVVAILAGVMLIADKAIIWFMRPREQDFVYEDEVGGENAVPVMGEIKPGPVRGLSERFKPRNENAVPVVSVSATPLVRTSTSWTYPPLTLRNRIDAKPVFGNIKMRMEVLK